MKNKRVMIDIILASMATILIVFCIRVSRCSVPNPTYKNICICDGVESDYSNCYNGGLSGCKGLMIKREPICGVDNLEPLLKMFNILLFILLMDLFIKQLLGVRKNK